MPTRNETLRAFHEAAGFEFPLSVTKQLFHDWHMHPILVGGELAGGYVTKGPEIHVAVLEPYRGRWFLKWCRNVIAGLLDRHGVLKTSAMRENTHSIAFIERVGFRRIYSDDLRHYYELSEGL